MCQCENCGTEMDKMPADDVYDKPAYYYCRICGNAELMVEAEAITV